MRDFLKMCDFGPTISLYDNHLCKFLRVQIQTTYVTDRPTRTGFSVCTSKHANLDWSFFICENRQDTQA
jgi:hypothetical protein